MPLLCHCSTKFKHSPGYHALFYLFRLLLFSLLRCLALLLATR